MQRNIHCSIWCVKIFLFLALMFASVSCYDNGSTSAGHESDVSLDVADKEAAAEDQKQEEIEEALASAMNEDDAKGEVKM